MSLLVSECWREERAQGDGVWEQVPGERRGQGVTIFDNRLLELGEAVSDVVCKQ